MLYEKSIFPLLVILLMKYIVFCVFLYGEFKRKRVAHPLYRLLHDEPNPEMTSFVFRETLVGHLLLWGNSYAQIIRNGKGEVIALYTR